MENLKHYQACNFRWRTKCSATLSYLFRPEKKNMQKWELGSNSRLIKKHFLRQGRILRMELCCKQNFNRGKKIPHNGITKEVMSWAGLNAQHHKRNGSLYYSRGVSLLSGRLSCPICLDREQQSSSLAEVRQSQMNLDTWMARRAQCSSHWQQVHSFFFFFPPWNTTRFTSVSIEMQWGVEVERNCRSSDPGRYSRWGRTHSVTFNILLNELEQPGTFQHLDTSLLRQRWTNSDEACSTCCTSTLTRAASYFIINPYISLNQSGCSPVSSAVSVWPLQLTGHLPQCFLHDPWSDTPGLFTLWHSSAEMNVPVCLSFVSMGPSLTDSRSLYAFNFSIIASGQMLGELSLKYIRSYRGVQTFSVMIRSTHCFPVKGRLHFSRILCLPPWE